MSTQVGTLQPRPRFSHLVGPAVAIMLIAVAAIGTFSVLNEDSSSGSGSSARSVNAEAERWSAIANGYVGGRAVATDAARWTAVAEANGAVVTSEVLGITTPSELRAAFISPSDPATGAGRRGVTPRMGETSQSNGPGPRTVGGDTEASHHPLP
jgi:hypothetical protein